MTTDYATDEAYVTDEAHGELWRLMLGDSCERLAEIPDNSIDLSVCSPPFASLYVYSPSLRDLGNCSTRGEFLEHYSFIIREQLRVTKPGRIACVHVQQLTHARRHGRVHRPDRLPRRGHPRVPGRRVDLPRRGDDLEEPAGPGDPDQGALADVRQQEPRLGGYPARARGLPADLQEARRQRGADPARGDHGRGHERRLDRVGIADLVRPARRRGRRRGSPEPGVDHDPGEARRSTCAWPARATTSGTCARCNWISSSGASGCGRTPARPF